MALFRNLGPFRTTAIGHGEMPLTIENNRGHDVGIETLHASLDAGCRHIDTAWAYYTPGEEEQTGEKLVREALDSWKGPREEVTVATKVGLRRAWDGDGVTLWCTSGEVQLAARSEPFSLASQPSSWLADSSVLWGCSFAFYYTPLYKNQGVFHEFVICNKCSLFFSAI